VLDRGPQKKWAGISKNGRVEALKGDRDKVVGLSKETATRGYLNTKKVKKKQI